MIPRIERPVERFVKRIDYETFCASENVIAVVLLQKLLEGFMYMSGLVWSGLVKIVALSFVDVNSILHEL